jgi:hypothetical protein
LQPDLNDPTPLSNRKSDEGYFFYAVGAEKVPLFDCSKFITSSVFTDICIGAVGVFFVQYGAHEAGLAPEMGFCPLSTANNRRFHSFILSLILGCGDNYGTTVAPLAAKLSWMSII